MDEYSALVTDFLRLDVKEPLRELRLNESANAVAHISFELIEQRIGENPAVEGWMGKAFGQMLRIAGVLHCAIWGTDAAKHEIERETVVAADDIIKYFISHAKAALTDVDIDDEIRDSRELYRRMLENEKDEGKTEFSKTDLYKLTQAKMPKARLEAALAKLMEGQRIAVKNPLEEERKRRYALLEISNPFVDESQLC